MEITLLVGILKNTPTWVFSIFFVLLAFGYLQSKSREVGIKKVFILPGAMITLSLLGVISSFGYDPAGLFVWLVGLAVATWLGLLAAAPKGVRYFGETRTFSLPGSWIPLLLMMSIFFTRYTVGVLVARGHSIAEHAEFALVVSVLYGVFSGLFFARLLVIGKAVKRCA